MLNNDRHFLIMGLLLFLSAVFSISLYVKDVRQTDTVQIKDFPRLVGDWKVVQDIVLTPQQLAILETDNAFIRKYRNSKGEEVYLYIVYSQGNRKVSHPPEICYTGEGVSILEKTKVSIPVSYKNMTISAIRLVLQANQAYQVAFYWFKVGHAFTSSYWKEQAMIAFDALLGHIKGSALIRVSADMADKNKEAASQAVREFTDRITPQLFEYLP